MRIALLLLVVLALFSTVLFLAALEDRQVEPSSGNASAVPRDNSTHNAGGANLQAPAEAPQGWR